MPVLAQVRERLQRERPLEGLSVAACLHVTAETANLVRTLIAGGAQVGLCAANPLSTQDDVALALTERHGATVLAVRGESAKQYAEHVQKLVQSAPQVTIDDGADLVGAIHERNPSHAAEMLGGTEETTAGLLRVRALAEQGALACPVLAVNSRAPSVRSTIASAPASPRSMASCARPTCCSPDARSWCSAMAGQGAAWPCALAARVLRS